MRLPILFVGCCALWNGLFFFSCPHFPQRFPRGCPPGRCVSCLLTDKATHPLRLSRSRSSVFPCDGFRSGNSIMKANPASFFMDLSFPPSETLSPPRTDQVCLASGLSETVFRASTSLVRATSLPSLAFFFLFRPESSDYGTRTRTARTAAGGWYRKTPFPPFPYSFPPFSLIPSLTLPRHCRPGRPWTR